METPELKPAKAETKRLDEELEQKVEERTRELATANEALRSESAERKLAVEAVTRAEGRIRLVIDTIPTMAWSLRPNGMLDFVNQRWLDYTGLSFEEAIEKPNGIVYPEDIPRVMERWLNDKAAGTSSEDEMRLRGADGEYRWFLVRTVPLLDEQGNIVKWYGTSTDIEDRKRAAKELEEANHQLRFLSRRLFQIQEEERRHLARELHDEIGQTLTAAKINLKIIAPNVPAAAAGRLEDSMALLDGLLGQVRQLSLDLHSPVLDELGLVPALRLLVDHQAQRAGLRATFTTNAEALLVEPAVQTACFRVAQEAITNAIRHSGAKSVAIDLRREPDRLRLSVRDDGAGFDPVAVHLQPALYSSFGLVSMKERALLVRGDLEVRSEFARGTEIRAWFPLVFQEPGFPPDAT
jgi:PAS domain S-box-containing protein